MKRVHAAFMAGMALAFAPAIAGTVHLDKSMCHVAPAPLTRRLRLQFGSGQACVVTKLVDEPLHRVHLVDDRL